MHRLALPPLSFQSDSKCTAHTSKHIHYLCCSKSDEPFELWYNVEESDFQDLITNPPATDRGSLGWNEKLVNSQLIMKLSQVGYQGWYLAEVTKYNSKDDKHTLKWDDGSPSITINLMACKVCFEWRLVQSDEDITKAIAKLNGDGEEPAMCNTI